ncbi:hypothetical protein [Leclercia adecarboxylata]|uniref:hypothetical protein n=1 Tax=Leclercia adecarboxylata TaxID=83655 RepID=UPI0013C6DAD3|nr:hypothetical protein [Leclercia adecarboxylata]NEG94110.1 hypothetical protein [Leclercia adecarboxylata]
MAERPKRQTLQLDITQAARQSPSIARLHERFKGERTSIVKRALLTDTLRSGAMVEEAGLSNVFAFLDTQKFHLASQMEKQMMILQAFQLRLDLDISTIPAATSSLPATPPAEESKPAETVTAQVQDEPAPVKQEDEQTAVGDSQEITAASTASKRFKKFGGA